MKFNVVVPLEYTNTAHIFKENSRVLFFIEIQKWYEYREMYNDKITFNFIYLTKINEI